MSNRNKVIEIQSKIYPSIFTGGRHLFAFCLLLAAMLASGQTDAACTQVSSFYTNTGSYGPGPFKLQQWDGSGALLSSVPLAKAYGDIAINSTGTTLYAVTLNDPLVNSSLDIINPATGTVTSSVTIKGPAASVGWFNALSIQANGSLLLGSVQSNSIWELNPATGVTTLFPASFPGNDVASGLAVTQSPRTSGWASAIISENSAMT